ncbi:MAG TPA: G1 family glutamic endopeptidase [Gaiellaceae bacterium]
MPVLVQVRVENASTCTFLRQYSAFSALYPYKTVSCTSGRAAVVIPAISNAYKAPLHLSFEVSAVGSGAVTRRIVKVTEAAAPSPPRPVVTITPPPPPPVVTATSPPAPPPPAPYATSTNWSGYVLPSSTSIFTGVAGTFTVPTLDCSTTPDAGMSLWVGIGGAGWPDGTNSGALLQTGVASDCVSGGQVNSGWWELYPSDPNHSYDFSGFPMSAGDTITAFVFQDRSGAWWTRLDDTTTSLSGFLKVGGNWGVGTNASGVYRTQGSGALLSYIGGYSAEWIVEDYTESDTQTLTPLANFGTVGFTNLGTSASDWFLTPHEGIELTDSSGNVLAAPSSPGSDGSFTVTYEGSVSP